MQKKVVKALKTKVEVNRQHKCDDKPGGKGNGR